MMVQTRYTRKLCEVERNNSDLESLVIELRGKLLVAEDDVERLQTQIKEQKRRIDELKHENNETKAAFAANSSACTVSSMVAGSQAASLSALPMAALSARAVSYGADGSQAAALSACSEAASSARSEAASSARAVAYGADGSPPDQITGRRLFSTSYGRLASTRSVLRGSWLSGRHLIGTTQGRLVSTRHVLRDS